jgi:short-subunit dehydrogenase
MGDQFTNPQILGCTMIDSTKGVVITGASRGIGREIARSFARRGYALLLMARNRDHVQEVVEECLSMGASQVIGRGFDFRSEESLIDKLEIPVEFPKIAVLINNAGHFLFQDMAQDTLSDYEEQFRINVLGAIACTQHWFNDLKAQNHSLVVNICSKASVEGYDDAAAYAVSKHALLGYGRSLRVMCERNHPHIGVCNILLGQTFSSSWDGIDVDPERLINPVDVAEMIYGFTQLSARSVVEELTIMPAKGILSRDKA